MRKVCFYILVLVFASLASAVRADDKTTGEIVGTVRGTDDALLSGARATLRGAGLIVRSLEQVTGATGQFRFPNLTPGAYVLEVALAGFAPFSLDVTVNLGRTAVVDARLAVAGTAEAVTVTGANPLIDRASPQISTNYTEQTLKRLPVGSNREWVELMDTTASVTDKGAYGTGNGLDPEVIDDKYEKGSMSSAYHLNGVDVSNAHYGTTYLNPEYDTIQEVQVLGPGASAQYTNFTGAVVNVVTKSGTNDFHGSLSGYYTGKSLVADNSSGIEDLNVGTIRYGVDAALTLGGPIVKEKLLFFGAVGYHPSSTRPPQATVFDESRRETYQLRLDYLISARNTISAMYNRDPITDDNLGLQAGSGPEIGYHYDFRTDTGYASWQSVWSSKMFSELKYAGYTAFNLRLPNAVGPITVIDYSTGQKYNSSGGGREFRNRRHGGDASVTRYADDFLKATHDLKAGVEYENAYTEDFAYYSGNAAMYLLPLGGGVNYVGGFLYDGSRTKSRIRRFGAFVQDDARFGRGTTVSVGLRFDNPKLVDAYDEKTLTSFNVVSPRFGVTQTLGSSGKTVVHAFFGRYYDKLLDYSISFVSGQGHSPGYYYHFTTTDPVSPTDPGLYNRLFQPANFDYIYNSGRLPVDPDLKMSHTDAWTFGIEQQLGNRFAIAGRFIYKKDRDFFALIDRTTHTYEPLLFDPGSGLDPVTVFTRTDTLPNDYVQANSDKLFREHKIAILELQSTATDKLSMRGSLSWERNTGTIENDFSGLGGFSNFDANDPNFVGPRQNGILTFDRTWQFKLLGTYALPFNAYITADFRWYSGRAWTPVQYSAYVPDFQDPTFFGGISIFLDDRGSRRWESTTLVNLRLAKAFDLGRFAGQGSSLEVGVDGFNLLNDDSPVEVGTSLAGTYFLHGGSNFGKPTKLVKPRQFRFGARFSF